MSEGNITRRGKQSWRIKFDHGRDPATGKRRTLFLTVRGTRKDAERELRNRLSAADVGIVIDPTKLTVADHLTTWLADVAAPRVSDKTLERYRELVSVQIVPHIGAVQLQKLRPADISAWHTTLRTKGSKKGGPLSRRTVRQAHQVLRKALADAAAVEMLPRNVAALVAPPPIIREEVEILNAEQVTDALRKLEGLAIHPLAVLAFTTGMRRGEIAALRWADVDLEGATVRVERSLEQTKAGLRFKAPKTAAGRRTISLPAAAVDVLRTLRREHLERRLALGQGRMPAGALIFAHLDGSPRSPHGISDAWREAVVLKKLPPVTFHALRHSHASALIAAGLDPVSVSKRLGHGSPAITLSVYSHLFTNTDGRAAAAIDAALGAK